MLEESAAILSRANQALATLERYKLRLDEVAGTLSALEIEDLVTVRDVTAVAQRLEMVRRIATEIAEYVVELGTDGRLLALQLDELIAGVEPERELVVRDYVPEPTAKRSRTVSEALTELDSLSHPELLDLATVARALGYSGSPETLDSAVSPRGYRLLAKVPRLPGAIIERLVEHFGGLQKLLAASVDDLQAVDGVGELRARSVRKGCRGSQSRRSWSATSDDRATGTATAARTLRLRRGGGRADRLRLPGGRRHHGGPGPAAPGRGPGGGARADVQSARPVVP